MTYSITVTSSRWTFCQTRDYFRCDVVLSFEFDRVVDKTPYEDIGNRLSHCTITAHRRFTSGHYMLVEGAEGPVEEAVAAVYHFFGDEIPAPKALSVTVRTETLRVTEPLDEVKVIETVDALSNR